jgi:hypothetical protein
MTDDTRSDKELADAEVDAYLAIDDTREQLHALLDGWRIPRVVSGDPRDTFSLYERAWLLSERYRKVAPEEFDHARLERAMAAANLARITAARKAVAAASPPPDVAAQAVKAALVPHSEGDHRWGGRLREMPSRRITPRPTRTRGVADADGAGALGVPSAASGVHGGASRGEHVFGYEGDA